MFCSRPYETPQTLPLALYTLNLGELKVKDRILITFYIFRDRRNEIMDELKM